MDNQHRAVKGCKIDDTLVFDDGTTVCIQRRAKSMGTTSDKLTVVIKRDTPIGKIIVIKRNRGGNK